MFEALGERLQAIFHTLRGHGHLTEKEIREGVRESGTAAVDQVGAPGRQIAVPAADASSRENAASVCRAALREARQVGRDPLIVDTAGRLHIDEELMAELAELKTALQPVEILYVADAMTGQDTVRAAGAFHARLALTGMILSKADGDSRGGAALSIRKVLGVPIRFMGVGEHLEDLEPFHPERMASRILGMGDVLTLIEKAEAVASKDEAEPMARRVERGEVACGVRADHAAKRRPPRSPRRSSVQRRPG